jgi:hypothetical protein
MSALGAQMGIWRERFNFRFGGFSAACRKIVNCRLVAKVSVMKGCYRKLKLNNQANGTPQNTANQHI